MSEACDDWITLSDRDALGEPLTREEQTFFAQHGASCAACARELAVWARLETLLDASPPAPLVVPPAPALQARPVLLPREVSETRVHKASSSRYGRWRRNALAVCAAAALLAGVLRFSSGGAHETPAAGRSAAVVATTATRAPRALLDDAVPGGQVEVDGVPTSRARELVTGATVFALEGPACLTVEPGVRACLTQGSLLRVAELSAERRRLELVHGKLVAALLPQPSGTSFGVLTRGGSAIAVGTAFTVEVPPGVSPVVTRVLHGTVLVRGRAGHERHLTAHGAAAMDGEPRTMQADEEARERALIEPTARFDPTAGVDVLSANPVARSAPAPSLRASAAAVQPKGTGHGSLAAHTTLSPPQPPGRSRTRAEHAPVARRVHTRGDAAPTLLVGSTATQLLSHAREARAHGDLEGARAAYQELFARHRDSSEAQAARVPYGELLLAEGAARAALHEFDSYLERSGPLEEEASFGRVRALRVLGDTAGERTALRSFLASYPSSPLRRALMARARSLGAFR